MRLSSKLTLKYLISLGILIVFLILAVTGLSYLPKSNLFKDKVVSKPSEVLGQIAENTTLNQDGVSVSKQVLECVVEDQAWIQILDGEGREIYRYNAPLDTPKVYAPGELLVYRINGEALGYQIYTWFEETNPHRLTWIYGKQYEENLYNSYVLWIVVIGGFGLFTGVIALTFGLYLGRPLIHILNWIDALSKNHYGEPMNKKGDALFRKTQTGKLRWGYGTYQEIIESITLLTKHLAECTRQRELLDQAREEWLGGVSHDMKTPLSSVKGYADLMASKTYPFDQEEVRTYAGIISDKALYMEKLIEDLNLTCRLSHKALPIHFEVKDLMEMVRRSVIDLINNERGKGKIITFEVQEDKQFLYPIDEKWFKRAFDNLLINAVTHNKDGTQITVKLEMLSEQEPMAGVRLTIADDGDGIGTEAVEHIFDRYYRGTSTAEYDVKGSGLGLAIAKQLIEAHGGTVGVESQLGTGTIVEIVLPDKKLS